jgi:putative tryptophan/tyrosine transport system substrate-binding protein
VAGMVLGPFPRSPGRGRLSRAASGDNGCDGDSSSRGLAGAAAWPLVARAQQPPDRMRRIGYLFAGTRGELSLSAFRKGLSEMGFVEGRNVTIEESYAGDQYDRLPALATELVRRQVAVIFAAGGNLAGLAAKAATTTIPIVFVTGGNPVEGGLVTSFNRPAGNVTGINFISSELTGKRLGLLHDLLPSASRFAFLENPNNQLSFAAQTADAQAAASAIGRQIEIFAATTEDEIDKAIASMVQWRAEALLIGPGTLFTRRGMRQLAGLTVRYALPAIHFLREFVEVGGLMSYGTNIADINRQAGIYVGRILKGEKPTDLPVQQPTKFELFINLGTARILGVHLARHRRRGD